jgi:hypothetical protein
LKLAGHRNLFQKLGKLVIVGETVCEYPERYCPDIFCCPTHALPSRPPCTELVESATGTFPDLKELILVDNFTEHTLRGLIGATQFGVPGSEEGDDEVVCWPTLEILTLVVCDEILSLSLLVSLLKSRAAAGAPLKEIKLWGAREALEKGADPKESLQFYIQQLGEVARVEVSMDIAAQERFLDELLEL